MKSRAQALIRCLTLFSLPGTCPEHFSPTVLWEKTRTEVNSVPSVCLCHFCLNTGRRHTTPVPDSHFFLSYSLACPAPIPSPLAQPYASGFQQGVTGSLDFWQEVGGVGVGWFQVYGGRAHRHTARQYTDTLIQRALRKWTKKKKQQLEPSQW